MADVNRLIQAALGQIREYAREHLQEYADTVVKDAQTSLEAHKGDLERWSALAVDQQLSPEEVKDLIATRIAVDLLEGLKQKGMGVAQADKFKGALIDIVFNVALGLIPS